MKTTFYKEFCEELKITPENNKIKLETFNRANDIWIKSEREIFTEDKAGNVDILVYTLGKRTITVKDPKANPDKDLVYNNRDKDLVIKRYAVPKEIVNEKTGEVETAKYLIPKGAKSSPFFPPMLCDKYEKGEHIKTLVLTEGAKKAWYGALFGLPVVGLGSITSYKDRDTQEMYADIISLIKKCNVENVIMLYDGDCFNISQKALDSGKDLYKRPSDFFNSCCTVRELLKFKDSPPDVYFAHVNSESVDGHPKGLDDILIAKSGHENDLIDDLLALSKPGIYFKRTNITNSTSKMAKKFNLNFDSFYQAHAEIINEKEFIYRGTTYKWDEKQQQIIVVTPERAKHYFQVGDTFFEWVPVPNAHGRDEKQFHARKITTIKQRNGNDFIKHIPYYNAFCNVPEHENFAPVIQNCFNLYHKMEHEPEPGDCPVTLEFLEHIFGEQLELGLDYIQLLYQKPTQILPIFCMVSKENGTGKSTFIKWIGNLFGQNATLISNNAFNTDFNSGWASKLVISCEEFFIDKKAAVERLKALSTASKIPLEFKGKESILIDFFGKFILASNEEEKFVIAGENDIRYWVRKIPLPKTDNVEILKQLIDEIPAFLHYLNNRKISTQNESRMWFRPSLLVTDALVKLREANRPRIEKTIVQKIKNLFIDTADKQQLLSMRYIKETILQNPKEDEYYVRKILTENLKVHQIKNENGKIPTTRFEEPYWTDDGVFLPQKRVGRPYVFDRDKFITPEELEQYEIKNPEEANEF
jgi:hypothetical protein